MRQAESEKVALEHELIEARAAIDETESALAASQEARIEREREHQIELARVQTATPVQLVDQGAQLLGVSDITTDGTNVSMPVETYRKVVLVLVSHHEYVTVKEPRWLSDEAKYKSEISGWKVMEIKWSATDALNASIIAGLKDVVSHTKTTTFIEKAAWSAAGFAAGAIFGKL